MQISQKKTKGVEVIGCCKKMDEVMDCDHPEHGLYLNGIHGDWSHCPFCGEEIEKMPEKVEPLEINWENVDKHWADLQHGFCPVCGGLENILVLNFGELGVCDTHKIVWVNSTYSCPLNTEAEEKEKLELIEGYGDGTEEVSDLHKVIQGAIERLSNAEDGTIACTPCGPMEAEADEEALKGMENEDDVPF